MNCESFFPVIHLFAISLSLCSTNLSPDQSTSFFTIPSTMIDPRAEYYFGISTA